MKTRNRGESGDNSQVAVLVHGLWMTGLEMRFLGAGLRDGGFAVRYFHYPSLSLPPFACAERLASYISDLRFDRVHLVAHSLGGIVVLNLFHHYRDLPQGRIVLLGSPVQGSGVARLLARYRLTRPLLGVQAQAGLVAAGPPWQAERELGVIAGTRRIGVGRLLSAVDGEHDGTVSVHETELSGASARCQLEVSHMGLLFSPDVVRQTLAFLRQGRFEARG